MPLAPHTWIALFALSAPMTISLEPSHEAPPMVGSDRDVLVETAPSVWPSAAEASLPTVAEREAARAAPRRASAVRFFVGLAEHQREIVLAPARLRASDWMRWGPPLAAAATLMVETDARPSMDEEVAEEVKEHATSSGGDWAGPLSRLGDGDVAAALWGSTWLAAHAAGMPRFQRTVTYSGEALLDSTILSHGMKLAFGRARPRSSDDGSYPGGPLHALRLGSSGSFPSGHAMAAFAVATVVAERNPNRRWVAPVAYGLAAGVAASRVYGEHHYLSDVVVGGVIGHGVGKLVLRRHGEGGSRGTSAFEWSVVPTASPSTDSVGVQVSMRRRASP